MVKVGLLLALISLGVVGASADLFSFLNGRDVDFDGLNKWLEASLSYSDSMGENLAYLRANLDHVDSPKRRRAADLLLEFVDLTKCDQNVLAHLREMVADAVDVGGSRRVERMMRPEMPKVNELCGRFLDETTNSLYTGSFKEKLGEFVRQVVFRPTDHLLTRGMNEIPKNANSFHFYQYLSSREDHSMDPKHWQWIDYMSALAGNDDKAKVFEKVYDATKGATKKIKHRENFDYSYQKYLVEPCKLYATAFDQAAQQYFSLSELQRSDVKLQNRFLLQRDPTALRLIYGYKVCKSLKHMSKANIYGSVYFLLSDL